MLVDFFFSTNGSIVALVAYKALQDEDGHSYLKLAATNHIINKLICPDAPKNASLSSSEKLNELKSLRNQKLGLEDDLAADDWQLEDEAENGPSAKKKRGPGPTTVGIDVKGVMVKLLVPGKRASKADLCVSIDAGMLEAVFEFVKPDCGSCSSIRTYKRTGLYKTGEKSGQKTPA